MIIPNHLILLRLLEEESNPLANEVLHKKNVRPMPFSQCELCRDGTTVPKPTDYSLG